MKQNISVSLSEDILKEIDKLVDGIRFRNKSHVLEYSLNKMLQGEKNE